MAPTDFGFHFSESSNHLTLSVLPPPAPANHYFFGNTIKGILKPKDGTTPIFKKYTSIRVQFRGFSLGAQGVIPGVSGQDTTGLDKHVFLETEEMVWTKTNNEGGYISFEIKVPENYTCKCWKTQRNHMEVEKDLLCASMRTPFEDLSRVAVIYEVLVTAVKPGFLKAKDTVKLELPFGVRPATRDTFELLTEVTNEVVNTAKLTYAKGEAPKHLECHLTAPPILTPPHFTLPYTLTLTLPSSPSSLSSITSQLLVTSTVHRKNSTRGMNKPGKYDDVLTGFKQQSTYDISKSNKGVVIVENGEKCVIEGQVFVLTDHAITIRSCAVNVEYFLQVHLTSPSFSKGTHIVELPIFIPSIGYFTDNPPPAWTASESQIGFKVNGVNGHKVNGHVNGNGNGRFDDGDSLPDYDHQNGLDFDEKKEEL